MRTVWRLIQPGEASTLLPTERAFDSMAELVAAMQSAQILPTCILLSPAFLMTSMPITVLQYKELCFDPERLEVQIPAEEKSCLLSFKEAQILKKLLSVAGSCVPRTELYTLLWGSLKVSSRTLDSHVSRLRAKLEGSQVEILNVYGDGYVLK